VCLVDDATATGQALAAGLYAQPARPFDGRVAVAADAARTVAAVVGPEGGTLVASGADGTSYTLALPAGALVVPTAVAMTPVAEIGDLPLTGGLVAAVQFAPEGLALPVPATLTIVVPQAVDPAGLVAFDWSGLGGDFGLGLVAASGQTLTLLVTHFSGVGAGTAAPADVEALRTLPGSPARAAAGAALAALLLDQGTTAVGPYAAVLADWYDAAVAPALAVAATSDAALREALREYVQWHTTVEVVGGVFGDLEAVLGAHGFALATRRAAAAPLVVAGLRAGVARAKVDCRAQRSLERAEDAFRWTLIASALGFGTAEHGLDRASVLEAFCVEARFEELVFPGALAAGVPATLRVRAGYRFDGPPTRFDQLFGVIVSPSGTVEALTIGLTDADGRYEAAFTPTGEAAVGLEVSACLQSAAFPALSLFNLCQQAFVARGDLTVTPDEVALVPGGQQQFTAAIFGAPTGAVTWTATGGTITANGLYTAGDEPGSFTVTATSTLDPSVEATADVEIASPTFAVTGVAVGDRASAHARYLHQDAVGQNPVWVEDRPPDHWPEEITSPDAFPIVGGVDLAASTLGSAASCSFTASADVESTGSGIAVTATAIAVASATRQAEELPVTTPGAGAGCNRYLYLDFHVEEPWDFAMSATGSGDGFYTMELYRGGSLVACLTQNGGRRYRCVDGEVEDTEAPTEVFEGTLSGACTIQVTWSTSACRGFGCGSDTGPSSVASTVSGEVATDFALTLVPASP
jgi:hypothetical protein